MAEVHEVREENAEQFWQWLRERGGIAIWQSINLSNLGASWSTPARTPEGTPTPKPTWQAANEPARVITDPAEVVVVTGREVKRFHVALRMGSQGLSMKLTDASTEHVRSAVAKAEAKHGAAWYEFDYDTQEAVIFIPVDRVPLADWAAGRKLPKFRANAAASGGRAA